jgi:hypothetical protein
MNRIINALLIYLLPQTIVCQISVTLQISKDASIGFHDGANTANLNFGNAIQNAAFWIPSTNVSPGSNGNRALMDFNLSVIPSGATILTASLDLYGLAPYGSLPGHTGTLNSVCFQRIIQPWTEYGVTWINQPLASSVNQVTVQGSAVPGQDFLNITVTDLVQDMINNPGNSYGFMMKLINEVNTNALIFASKDHATQAMHPVLHVNYTLCNDNFSASGPVSGSVCSGSTVSLNATGGASQIAWYNTVSSGVPLGYGQTFVTPVLNAYASPTVITFYAGIYGCDPIYKKPVNITVHPTPTVIVNGVNEICAGNSTLLYANGALNYFWQNATTATSLLVFPSVTTEYTVTGIGLNGCEMTTSKIVSVNPTPNLKADLSSSTICIGNLVTLSVSGANSYTWNEKGVAISYSPALEYTPSNSTTLLVTGKIGNCYSSDSLVVFVDECTNLNDFNIPGLSLYPNPNTGVFFINTSSNHNCIEISDINGKLINTLSIEEHRKTELDLRYLQNGVYFINIFSDTEFYKRTKLIIRK